MVIVRMSVRRVVLIAVVGASALLTGACGAEQSPGSGGAETLVTIPQDTAEAMFGTVSGTLGLNSKDCFTLDERVLVVGKESRILDGQDAIEIADVGVVKVGDRASGSGGYIDGADEVENYAQSVGLGGDVLDCQLDDENVTLAVLDPASS
jgi:hypothetical protein